MPGPPPRQHEHERIYKLFTHPFFLARQIWKDYYDGQMIFGDLVGLKLPDNCLTGVGNPRKNLTIENLIRPGIERRPAASQERMLLPSPQRWTLIPNKKVNHYPYHTNTLGTS